MGIFAWLKSQFFYKGRTLRTMGTVKGENAGMVGVELRVHVLEGKDGHEKKIAVEIAARSLLSYQLMPCTLTAAEGRKLVELLSGALRE